MDERLNRIKSWIEGDKEGPFYLDIVPTNRCNLSCLTCPERETEKENFIQMEKKELSTDKYKQIIDNVARLSVIYINILGGGEPFLREDIIEIMQYIKNKNINGYVITNGTLLDKETIKEIVSMNWDALAVSLDAPDAKTHDYLRQKKGTFKKIIRAIKQFNAEKRKQNKEKPIISINYLLTNKNYDKIVKFVKLCHKLDIGEIQLMHMLVCSKVAEELIIKNEQKLLLDVQFKESLKLTKRYDINNNITDISNFIQNSNTKKNQDNGKISKNICFEPFWHVFIGTSGYIAPCSMCLDNCTFPRTNYVEDINKKSLQDIWFGKKFQKFRKSILDGKNKNNLCETCCSTILINSQNDKKELKI